MEELLAALEHSAFAATMRTSVFLYPLANVVHVLGALVFFAAVAAMDVRVVQSTEAARARAFVARVRPVAIVAFIVQYVSGTMLLAPEATHLWHNPVLLWKFGAIGLGLLNVILLEVLLRRSEGTISRAMRGSAVLSLGAWLGTATAGRLIAYF